MSLVIIWYILPLLPLSCCPLLLVLLASSDADVGSTVASEREIGCTACTNSWEERQRLAAQDLGRLGSAVHGLGRPPLGWEHMGRGGREDEVGSTWAGETRAGNA